jgi:hypothetical protein
MKTDSATDRGKGILFPDQMPRPFKIILSYLLDETNDVVSRRASRITRRRFIFIKRPLGPPCSGLIPIHMLTGNGDVGHLRSTLELNLFGHLLLLSLIDVTNVNAK